MSRAGEREAALAHYLEGVGWRATERLVGVSHNTVMNWVLEEVAGQPLARNYSLAITPLLTSSPAG